MEINLGSSTDNWWWVPTVGIPLLVVLIQVVAHRYNERLINRLSKDTQKKITKLENELQRFNSSHDVLFSDQYNIVKERMNELGMIELKLKIVCQILKQYLYVTKGDKEEQLKQYKKLLDQLNQHYYIFFPKIGNEEPFIEGQLYRELRQWSDKLAFICGNYLHDVPNDKQHIDLADQLKKAYEWRQNTIQYF